MHCVSPGAHLVAAVGHHVRRVEAQLLLDEAPRSLERLSRHNAPHNRDPCRAQLLARLVLNHSAFRISRSGNLEALRAAAYAKGTWPTAYPANDTPATPRVFTMCVWREQCSLKEFGRLCFCRIFLDSFLGQGGSAAWFFAWVAVFLAVGGSLFAGWAREDARGALISRYDEQVYVWSGDIADAYARKWRAMGETADGLPALTIQRTVSAAATTHAGLALQTDTDLATGGDLPGDTGSDFARYDQGAVLTTTVPNFHSSSMLTERGAATFSVTRGGAAYSVTAAPRDCKTVIESKNGDPPQEYTVAIWRYLTAVELYEPPDEEKTQAPERSEARQAKPSWDACDREAKPSWHADPGSEEGSVKQKKRGLAKKAEGQRRRRARSASPSRARRRPKAVKGLR